MVDLDKLNVEVGGKRNNVWWRPALERFEGTNGARFKTGELLEVSILCGVFFFLGFTHLTSMSGVHG